MLDSRVSVAGILLVCLYTVAKWIFVKLDPFEA